MAGAAISRPRRQKLAQTVGVKNWFTVCVCGKPPQSRHSLRHSWQHSQQMPPSSLRRLRGPEESEVAEE